MFALETALYTARLHIEDGARLVNEEAEGVAGIDPGTDECALPAIF